ncbi:MAG: glycine cleavage system protein T [Anaerolineae bacterium]|nr:glycine cleavage system protein T [Anaerolineae bacterium]
MNHHSIAQQGVIWADLSARGCLHLTERDRLDLIHRMSTGNLAALQAGQAAETVLTTPIGRIIDLVTVLHAGEEAFAITGAGRGEAIYGYLRRNIFFNDRIRVTLLGAETRLLGLYGQAAAATLARALPAAAELPLLHFIEVDGVRVLQVKPLPADGAGYWLLGAPEAVAAWQARLAPEAPVADPATLELLRIEAGHPGTQAELTEDYIPLEAGLWDAVSFNKGCYTGQEIIARMESRGKLAKLLVRLQATEALARGEDLYHEQQKVGQVTSVAQHPDGHHLALGFVKPVAAAASTLYTAQQTSVALLGIAGTQPERS